MPPETAKLEKLKQLVTMVNEGITKTEFLQSFQAVLTQLVQLENSLIKKIDDTLNNKSQAFNEQISNLLSESKIGFQKMSESHEKTMDSMKTEMMKMMKNLMSSHDKKMEEMDDKMMEMHDGKDADEKMIIEKVLERIPKPKDGEPGKDIDPLTVEELQNELKSLKEETERIKNLPRGRMGARKVPIIKRVNLSSQCDGATKAFTLPRDTVDVVGVFGTQFPINFNPGTDWTFSGQTLTLGDSITAPATGETLFAIIETLFYGAV